MELAPLYEKIDQVLPNLQGWCTPEKAKHIAKLIVENDMELAVEIGVYGGRSLLPMGMAFEHIGKGKCYGIDPWCAAASVASEQNQANIDWWSKLDHEAIYRGFISAVLENGLSHRCYWLRFLSEQTAKLFSDGEIDLLHIDGNHSQKSALRDVDLWLPKVVEGGYIIFDDIDWQSTRDAQVVLNATWCGDPIYQDKSWAIYRKSVP